jgi:hypothetical protein
MAIGFAVATAFALIAVLIGFGYYTTLTQQIQQAKQASVVRQLCAALYPNFTWPHSGRDTTQTFHFMLSGMRMFGCILIIWSIGAGAMRATWLLSANPMHSSWLGGVGDKCATDGCTLQVWLFTLLQIVRAIGGAMLICLGSGLVGGFFGFLFGIPSRIAADGAAPDSTAAGKDKAAAANYALSTNLTQISDWLTKVIVGVSLVEAQNAYGGFITVSKTAAEWLFESRHGSPAVLAAALAGGAVFGFLFLYLYTQLILSRLIAAAERALGVAADATERLRAVTATARQLVPPIRRTSRPNDALQKPSEAEYEAAMAYYGLSFQELISNPAVSDEQVRSWARSRALLDDYQSAVLAYFYLLGRESS